MGVDTGKANGQEDEGPQFPEIFGVFLKCFSKGIRNYPKPSASDATKLQKLMEFGEGGQTMFKMVPILNQEVAKRVLDKIHSKIQFKHRRK